MVASLMSLYKRKNDELVSVAVGLCILFVQHERMQPVKRFTSQPARTTQRSNHVDKAAFLLFFFFFVQWAVAAVSDSDEETLD